MLRPRLVVVGDVGGPDLFHLGDEAMLEANLEAFREQIPEIDFTVPSRDPEWTAQYYTVESLPFPKIPNGISADVFLREAMDASDRHRFWSNWTGEHLAGRLREASGLVISGGGNLCESWPEKILERAALLELAQIYAVPAVVLGQTIGPALSPDQKLLLRRAFEKVRWIGVRDDSSSGVATSLGVSPERVNRQLDDAFFLPPQSIETGRSNAFGQSGGPRILVTIDASFQAPERQRTLSVLSRQLDELSVATGAELVFVPHVGGAAAGNALSDLHVGKALAAQMKSKMVLLDVWQPREVRWLTEEAAMVISTRYHGVVFAAAAGTPVMGISVDEYTRTKLRGALSLAGLDGWAICVDDVKRGALLPLAMELWHKRNEFREKLAILHAEACRMEQSRWQGICAALELKPLAARQVSSPAPFQTVTKAVAPLLSEEQWELYDRQGYLKLGRLLDDEELAELSDAGGAYEDLPGSVPGLEADPLILRLARRDLFREICAKHYGEHASISLFRVMMINQPPGQGTHLHWHQDGGDVWKLDRDRLVTSWIVLDPSTTPNGRVQVIPGSHKLGLLSKNDGVLSAEDAARHCQEDKIESLELQAGQGLLMHCWLLRRNEMDHSSIPRRTLSVGYMDGRTLNTHTGNRFPLVFGNPEDTESALPFLRDLRADNQRLRRMAMEAERYALSLLEDNRLREEMRHEAERYAKSLERELEKVREGAASAASRK
jgi:polysaccharide pyruvyl transferase WcaK-like protein